MVCSGMNALCKRALHGARTFSALLGLASGLGGEIASQRIRCRSKTSAEPSAGMPARRHGHRLPLRSLDTWTRWHSSCRYSLQHGNTMNGHVQKKGVRTMKRTHLRCGVILAGVVALSVGSRAWGAERALTVVPPAASSSSVVWFYSSSLVNVGSFPGTFLRLTCESDGATPEARSHQARQAYAFMLQGDDVLHPLLPGTEEVRRELSSGGLDGANATVYGKYYSSSGVIFVSEIVRTPGGADRGVALEPQAGAGSEAPRSLVRCASR
jgi:hypothetical protein